MCFERNGPCDETTSGSIAIVLQQATLASAVQEFCQLLTSSRSSKPRALSSMFPWRASESQTYRNSIGRVIKDLNLDLPPSAWHPGASNYPLKHILAWESRIELQPTVLILRPCLRIFRHRSIAPLIKLNTFQRHTMQSAKTSANLSPDSLRPVAARQAFEDDGIPWVKTAAYFLNCNCCH